VVADLFFLNLRDANPLDGRLVAIEMVFAGSMSVNGTAEWLRERDAVVENVALTLTPTRTVEVVALHLLADNGVRVELPVAIVSDRNPDRALKAVRVYHSL
jgi:hypothetical protein